MLAVGNRVKFIPRGVKWATSKKSLSMGIDWNKREGLITHIPNDKSIVMVTWDGNKALKPVPVQFLEKC